MARTEINKVLDTATESMIDILESYMDFVAITEKTIDKYAQLPKTMKKMSDMLIAQAKNNWMPVLKELKKIQKAQKSAKKTA